MQGNKTYLQKFFSVHKHSTCKLLSSARMKWDFLQLNSEKFQKNFKISFEKKQKKKADYA